MSYRAVICAVGAAKIISAPVYFGTWHEAQEFGQHSVDVLGLYLHVEKWRVEESHQPVNTRWFMAGCTESQSTPAKQCRGDGCHQRFLPLTADNYGGNREDKYQRDRAQHVSDGIRDDPGAVHVRRRPPREAP